IRAIKAINEKELQLGIKASWHDEAYSAYVYIGGLDPELTEGDVITIFSQYGEPVDINMPKEKANQLETSSSSVPSTKSSTSASKRPKSRGFCFLMYENQLSTNLAVDNLNGAVVLGRTLRVDHCKNYKQLERNQEGKMIERDADLGERLNARPELHVRSREKNDEEDVSDGDIDPEDPMYEYLIEKKRKLRRRKGEKRLKEDNTSGTDQRKHRRREGEDEGDRRARKNAKKFKNLL
ncbi:hypothetical protein BY996DRAFT_4575596, partial [Phakopsora pachyrhizi]